MPLPDDLILNAADEVTIRQHLLLVSMGKRPDGCRGLVNYATALRNRFTSADSASSFAPSKGEGHGDDS